MAATPIPISARMPGLRLDDVDSPAVFVVAGTELPKLEPAAEPETCTCRTARAGMPQVEEPLDWVCVATTR